jgi:hypothetical protein
LPFPFSLCRKQTEVAVSVCSVFRLRNSGHMDMETSNGKRKPRRFSLIRLLFAHRAIRSLPCVLLLTRNKRKLSVWKRLKGLDYLWISYGWQGLFQVLSSLYLVFFIFITKLECFGEQWMLERKKSKINQGGGGGGSF